MGITTTPAQTRVVCDMCNSVLRCGENINKCDLHLLTVQHQTKQDTDCRHYSENYQIVLCYTCMEDTLDHIKAGRIK